MTDNLSSTNNNDQSDNAPRTTRPIADFDDRFLGIPLGAIDKFIVALVAGWIVIVLVNAFSQMDVSFYSVMVALHSHLGRFSLAIAIGMFLLAMYIGLVRHADVKPYFRRGAYVVVGTMLLESIFGAILHVFLGARPGEEVHIIYGAATVLALPFFMFVEMTATKRPAMGSYMWGFALLAGVIVRSMTTGPIT
jgi:hypothetical protein